MRGLVIEDNLSSHKTELVNDFWKDELTQYDLPIFVPPNMTSYLQVVDRHIGIRYKKYVYRMYRREMLSRLNQKLDDMDADASIMKLTPAEKRILITHAIGDIHEKLCNAGAFQHAFFATGTWLPISHLIRHDYSTEIPASTNSATK